MIPVAARAAEFLALPLITRILDIEDFGLFDKSIALAMLLSVGAAFFLTPALHRLFRPGNKKLIFSTFLYGGGAITLGWFALAALIAAAGYSLSFETFEKYIGSPEIFGIALLIGCAIGFFRLQEVALIRLSNLVAIIFASLIPSILFLVGCTIAIFADLELTYLEVMLFRMLIALLQVILGFVFLAPYLCLRFSKRLILLACKFSLPLLPGVGLTWLSRNAIRWVILGALGLSSMAIFSAGLQLAAAVGVFTQVFHNMWFVFSMKRKSSKTRNLEFSTVWVGYFGFMAFLAGFLTIFGEMICTSILPAEYGPAHTVLPLLVIGICFLDGRVIGNVANFITGKTLSHIFDDIGTAIVMIGLGILLVPYLEILGAAIAVAAGGAFQVVRCRRNAKKKINLELGLMWPLLVVLCVAGFSAIRELGDMLGGSSIWIAKIVSVGLLLLMVSFVVKEILRRTRSISFAESP